MNGDRIYRSAIEEIYASFLAELPAELVIGAERLPRRLGLSRRGDLGWGHLFDDVPVLALPQMLMRDGAREVSAAICRRALEAHVLASVTAVIRGRVAAGLVETDADLDAVLGALRRGRDRALAELSRLGADRRASFAQPERELRRAFACEREVFEGRADASLAHYVAVSTAKQSMAFPALMAGSSAAGFDIEERAHIHDVILGAMLGLQIRDDVETWLENLHEDHSWIVALSGGVPQIHALSSMLEVARDAFDVAADSASALGAMPLTRWARSEARSIRELLRIAGGQLTSALAG